MRIGIDCKEWIVGNKSIDIFRYSDSRVDRLPVFVNKFYWKVMKLEINYKRKTGKNSQICKD